MLNIHSLSTLLGKLYLHWVGQCFALKQPGGMFFYVMDSTQISLRFWSMLVHHRVPAGFSGAFACCKSPSPPDPKVSQRNVSALSETSFRCSTQFQQQYFNKLWHSNNDWYYSNCAKKTFPSPLYDLHQPGLLTHSWLGLWFHTTGDGFWPNRLCASAENVLHQTPNCVFPVLVSSCPL